jgi:enterochelin esterase family protein
MDDGASTPIVEQFERIVAMATDDEVGSSFVESTELLFPSDAEPDGEGPREDFPIRHVVWKETALFLVESDDPVDLVVEDTPPVAMRAIAGSRLWMHAERLEQGRIFNYGMRVGGEPIGLGISPMSVPMYRALSYPIPGVPRGHMYPERSIVSDVYDGATVVVRVYANHGIDPTRGNPVMVWLDGGGCVGIADALGSRMQTVTDNLVHRGDIPPMAHVLVSPGSGGRRSIDPSAYHTGHFDMRTHQMDELSEEFNRHLLDEVLPAVARDVNLRDDGYSRGIIGGSSGGTAAFKVGWYAPEQFSRLHPYLPSFTAWGWRPADGIDGAHLLPLLVRREPRKNLRVWLSAGEWDDFDHPMPEHLRVARPYSTGIRPALHRAGSQALGQFEMAQALKTSGYDFHFRYGPSGHTGAQLSLDLPESLSWLWRGYDSARSSERYEPDEDERRKPPYRFGVINRDTW